MKEDKILDAVGDIGEDLITEADNYKRPKRSAVKWTAVIAALLSVAMIMGVALKSKDDTLPPMEENIEDAASDLQGDNAEVEIENENISESKQDFVLCKAVYPERTENPYAGGEENIAYDIHESWWDQLREVYNAYYDLDTDIMDFVQQSTQSVLEGKGNAVYSPINLFMALGMLAESTEGESRTQILDALGYEDIESLREEIKVIWNAVYHDDGLSSTLLANSLWLDQTENVNYDTLDILAENYYASAFEGEMGSSAFDTALQQWLNEQTAGLLEDQVSGLSLPPDTLLALASTIYFNGTWTDEFDPKLTEQGSFYTESGEVKCDFMHESSNGDYFIGEDFTAVSKSFKDVGTMFFILPDEDSSPEKLLENDELYDFIACDGRGSQYAELEYDAAYWSNSKHGIINLALPKFDVASQIDLTDGLCDMGITDVFDITRSDFSPITEKPVSVGSAVHGARVKIDEEGCEAAAYTMILCGSSAPKDEIDFTLDRPFVFVINSYVGVPLFIGVVDNP